MNNQIDLENALSELDEFVLPALGVEYFPINQTLVSILKNKLSGDKLELGIKVSEIHHEASPRFAEVKDILLTSLKDYYNSDETLKMTSQKISFILDNVPVEIKIFKKANKLFENLDIVSYEGEALTNQFNVPNPIEEYIATLPKHLTA